jgi:hypothetical protein
LDSKCEVEVLEDRVELVLVEQGTAGVLARERFLGHGAVLKLFLHLCFDLEPRGLSNEDVAGVAVAVESALMVWRSSFSSNRFFTLDCDSFMLRTKT